jgi:glucose/arabinose dehydrogenase
MRASSAVAALLVAPPAFAQDVLDPAVEDELVLELVVSGLNQGIGMDFLPDGRLVYIDKFGHVALWDGVRSTTSATIAIEGGGERGLLSIAVDPAFESSRRIYFYFSTNGAQVVAHGRLDPLTDRIDTSSLTSILEGVGKDRLHNGGGLAFGADGHLYLGVGDTGCGCGGACPPGTSNSNYFSTCLTNPHGKILRVDRDGRIPADNPLVATATVPACGSAASESCDDANDYPRASGPPRLEIFVWGLRNPWRFAFDGPTGFLWVGDVGAKTWEEITIVRTASEHHGWPFREGGEGQPRGICAEVVPTSIGPCVDPAFAYAHVEEPGAEAGSVTGGVFSAHCSWPESWRGLYWFGDYVKGRVWTLTPTPDRSGVVSNSRRTVVRGVGGVVQFAAGPDGSVWFVTINDGEIWRIRPKAPAECELPDAGVAADAEPAPDVPGADAETEDIVPVDSSGKMMEDEGCRCRVTSGSPALLPVFLLLLERWRRRDLRRRSKPRIRRE